MVKLAPAVKLHNGRDMPVVGLGTWLIRGDEGKELIKKAIDIGYRHFDTALLYHSEKIIGEAVKEKIEDGTVKREDLFITSKLWCSYAHPGMVKKACKLSLENLGLDYLDLYLIHWPFSFKPVSDPTILASKGFDTVEEALAIEEYFPRDETGNIITADTDYVDVWKEMEECVAEGMTRSIGVSNFNEEQIKRLLQNSKICPVTNQIEVHPYLNQKNLIKFCRENCIFVTAYGPLGMAVPSPWPGVPKLVENPTIKAIAERVRKTPAQVILRYLVQSKNIVIPKTINPKRLLENISLFDFNLANKDMAEIDALNIDMRVCRIPGTEMHKNYPFEESSNSRQLSSDQP